MSSSFLPLLLIFLAALASPTLAGEPWRPTALLVEYLPSPVLGVDVLKPRFSWQLQFIDPLRSHSQSAYEILISQDPLVPSGDFWDSGKVTSNQTVNIELGTTAKQLQSDNTYYWKVRFWDETGADSSYSTVAQFDTGLFQKSDWGQAQWIGGRDNALRKEIQLSAPSSTITRARLYICGLGYYQLFVNGRVSNNSLDPGWTHYSIRSLYVTHDVTDALSSLSVNNVAAIGVLLGRGWYGQGSNGPLSLLLRLSVTYSDGKTQVLVSDLSWAGTASPITYDSIYNGEWYDARLEQPGWAQPFFKNASAWHPAQAVSSPSPNVKLSSQLLPPIRKSLQFAAVKLTQPLPDTWVFDFGQNFAGWCRLSVKGPAGTVVTLRHGEILSFNGSGLIYVDNLRSAQATDRYTLRGDAQGEVYEPRFTYHGFRFVQLSGYPGQPTLQTLVAVHLHSAVSSVGDISYGDPSSDPQRVLNRIHQNIVWGQRSNLMSVPTDCDQRDERLGWMADGHLSAEEAIFNFDMAAFYTNWLNLIADDQGTDGSLTDVVPFVRYGNRPADPSWGAAYPLLVYWTWKYYGDERIVQQHYSGLKSYIAFLTGKWKQSGLKGFYGYYGDWVPPPPAKKASVSFTSGWYFLLNVGQLAELATSVMKNSDDAKIYSNLYNSLLAEFNTAWYSSSTGVYDIGVQTNYALALALGNDLVSPSQRPKVVANFLNNIQSLGYHLSTGIIGTKYLLETLGDLGRTDYALQVATATSYPGWGWEFANQTQEASATTIWELWDAPAEGPGMNSRNHIMYGSLDSWAYKYLAGLQQPKWGTGYRYVQLKSPDSSVTGFLGAPKSTSARLNWFAGVYESSWKFDMSVKKLEMKVTVPWNVIGEVHLNVLGISSANLRVSESGKVLWQNGYLPGVEGITGAKYNDDSSAIVVYLGSGYYDFTVYSA